jgi:mediator of RNA polymerase II transcription subunit 16
MPFRFVLRFTEQTSFIATYDKSHRLRVYKATFAWSQDATTDSNMKIAVEIQPLAFEDNCYPDPGDSSDHEVTYSTPSVALTHLEFLPAVQTHQMKQPLPPTVMAIFTPVSPANALVMDPTNQYHSSSSTICRWVFKEVGPETRLLPVFDLIHPIQGKPQTSTIPPRKNPFLERQPDHYMQALVLSVDVLRRDTMFAFSLSDGSIEFRFRESLELASADGNNEEVHTFQQSGFAFPAHDPGI